MKVSVTDKKKKNNSIKFSGASKKLGVEHPTFQIWKVDADGDGMLNFREFEQMMRGGRFVALRSS